MGKKNRIKQLIGRFTKETGSEIISMPYSMNGVVREMHVRVDLDNDAALAIANVPYFLDEKTLKELCTTRLDTPVVHVQFLTTTALHGDLKSGYRAGHLLFGSFQARKRAIAQCKQLEKEPIELEKSGVKVPAWHKAVPARRGMKRNHSMVEEVKEEAPEEMEVQAKKPKDEPDEEGWVTVTKEHKFSFRGKINRPGQNAEQMNASISGVPTDESKEKVSRAKKRRRTR